MRTPFVLLLLLVAGSAGAVEWTSGGPAGARTVAYVVAPSDPAVIYAAGVAGVFRSDNGGTTFVRRHAPLPGDLAILIDPRDPDVVLVASKKGLIRSEDGGNTWQAAGDGINAPLHVAALLADPRKPDVVYVGGKCAHAEHPDNWLSSAYGVYKSTDGGRTFARARSGFPTGYSACLTSLALDPAAPDRLHASFYWSGGVTSTDAGETWQPTFSHVAPSRAIVTSPDRRQYYGLGPGGVQVSHDEGTTWRTIAQFRGIGYTGFTEARSLDFDPSVGRLFLGGPHGAYRSGDGGLSWLPLAGPARDAIHALDYDPSTGAVTIATDYGLFRSAAYPWNVWTQLPAYDRSWLRIEDLAADPVNGDMYARSRMRIFRTRDHGASWEMYGDPIPASHVYLHEIDLFVDAGHTVYVSDPSAGVLRLDPAATEWKQIRATQPIRTIPMAVHPTIPSTIYLSEGTSMLVSRDGGETFEQLTTVGGFSQLIIDPVSDDMLMLSSLGVRRSADGGRTWSADKAPQYQYKDWLVVSPSHRNVLYLYARGKLARSGDGGETWVELPPHEVLRSLGDRIVIDPHDPDVLYLSADTLDGTMPVFRSVDGGQSWQLISHGLPKESSHEFTLRGPYYGYERPIAFDSFGLTLYAGTLQHGAWQAHVRLSRRRAAGK
jgi:photosystem II stability/assembly factor-like uncharacterized protein